MRKILIKKKKRKRMYKKNKKCLNKAEKFCEQIRQCTYFICTVPVPL